MEDKNTRRFLDVHPDVTPEDLAKRFLALSDEEGAEFFNALSFYGVKTIALKMQEITSHEQLNFGGRFVMKWIGKYHNWGLGNEIIKGVNDRRGDDKNVV